jgi:hypothetical protein
VTCVNCGADRNYARGLCRRCYYYLRQRGLVDDYYPNYRGWPRAELVAEVEFLHDTGADPETWAERLGSTPAAVAKALYRAGRYDLARHAQRIAWRQRQHSDEEKENAA